MQRLITLGAVLAAALALALPAHAATEADCEQAVAKTQEDMESNAGAMMERNSMQEEWGMRLEEAAGYGAQGDPDKCIETVKGVRGEAGLEPL